MEKFNFMHSNKWRISLLGVFAFLALAGIIVSIGAGSVYISPEEICLSLSGEGSGTNDKILMNIHQILPLLIYDFLSYS